jgi:hypothetical protein
VNINDMLWHWFILTITCYLATIMVDDKTNDDKQSTSSAGHFDSNGGAPVQYEAHCPMWHAQATPEATECHHRATTLSVLLPRPPF